MRASDVAIRYCEEHPYAATTLVGMSTVEQVNQNVFAAGQPLDPDLMEGIRRIARDAGSLPWHTGLASNHDLFQPGTADPASRGHL